jgi:hypothetical protein
VAVTVLEALKLLGAALTGLQQLGEKKREGLAKVCDEISSTLTEFIQAPEDRRESIHLCEKLRVLVGPIKDLAGGALLSEEINRLAMALNGICDDWSKFSKALESEGHSAQQYLDIDGFEKVIGQCDGLAVRLRAM